MTLIKKIISKIKETKKLRKFILWTIAPERNPRPRLWVRLFLVPLIIRKGKGVVIRSRFSRLDIFPWHKMVIGDNSTIESFTTLANGAGDIVFGKNVRIGIGSVVIGPVMFRDNVGLGQNIFISGFNHGYKNGNRDSSTQALDIRPVEIGEESHIGANSVIVAGVKIGKRCQIGAGSVVTKDIPDFSIAVGNPAHVIKQWNDTTQKWEKTIR